MSVYRRGKTWHYAFTIKGRRFRGSTLTTDKAQAQRLEAKLRLEAVESIHFGKAREMSLAEAFLRYREHTDLLPSGYTIAAQIEKLRSIGDGLSLSEIDDARVAEYIATRRGQTARNKKTLVSNSTVNREIATLRAVMRRASEQWNVNVARIRWRKHRLTEAQERRRYLTAKEEADLMQFLRPDFRPLVRFCLVTGARFASATALTWSDVDFASGVITFRTMKGGGCHTVPLTQELKILLANERGHHPVFAFTYECQEDRPPGARGVRRVKGERYPFSANGWRRPWARALKAAGIRGFRFHDLRHTALSRVTRTAGIVVAQTLAGHADITTTRRYAHVLMDDVKAAMERAASHANDTQSDSTHEISKKDNAL